MPGWRGCGRLGFWGLATSQVFARAFELSLPVQTFTPTLPGLLQARYGCNDWGESLLPVDLSSRDWGRLVYRGS